LWVAVNNYGFACNSCGCAPSSTLSGIGNYADKHYLGFRYLNRSFRTQLPDALFGNKEKRYHNVYYKIAEIDLWYKLSKKWRIQSLLPYRFIASSDPYENLQNNGFADFQVNAWHILIPTTKNKHGYSYSLLVGAGAELPTGKFSQTQSADASGNSVPFSLQPGSKSYDWQGQNYFQFGNDTWQLSQQSILRINGHSPQGYKFSNAQSNRLAGYYLVYNQDNYRINASLGANFEHYFGNKINGVRQATSIGSLGYTDAGVSINYKRLRLDASYFLPVYQNIGEGKVTTAAWLQTKISFQLNN